MPTRSERPLDKLGRFLVHNLRDRALDHADGLLAGRWKAPALQGLQAGLARLSPEQRELVRRCVTSAADTALHDLLFALQERADFGGDVQLRVDGADAAALSDGLQGEPFGEDGWVARYSAHRPPGKRR